MYVMTVAPRRRRNSLSRDEIVTAAFAMFEEGASDVSLRAVAARIGSSPMGLYAHIATKGDLLDALADRVLSELPDAAASGSWLESVVDLGVAHLGVLRRHPWAVPILLARPNPGPMAARIGESYLGLLGRGMDPAAAATAFLSLLALVYGTAAFATAPERLPDAQSRDEVVERIRRSAAGLDRTAAAADVLAEYGSEAHFRRSAHALVTGLAAAA